MALKSPATIPAVCLVLSMAMIAPSRAADTMSPISGVWIEGPGYAITYGAPYETCVSRCLETARCRMIEYYRPEAKCNFYDRERKTMPGGQSFVAVRRAAK